MSTYVPQTVKNSVELVGNMLFLDKVVGSPKEGETLAYSHFNHIITEYPLMMSWYTHLAEGDVEATVKAIIHNINKKKAPAVKRFVAHVGQNNQHSLRVFEVPVDHLNNPQYGGEVEAAGWWYMNKIDSYNCIGRYEDCIIPEEVFTKAGISLP